MNKKNAKRNATLSKKRLEETFRFQVQWGRKQKAPDIPEDSPFLEYEIGTVCSLGLADSLLKLRDIISLAEQELGYKVIGGRGSLKGSPIAYLLGIEPVNPHQFGCLDFCLAEPSKIQLPLQVEIFYDNEYRNEVVEWVADRYEGVSTRLGQPILKLDNMVVHFKRVITQ